MTPSEALKRLRQETCPATYNPGFDKEECLEVIEKALLELQAIKEAKPSEAINSLNKLWNTFISSTRTSEKYVEENPFVIRHIKDYDTIKQALLKQLSGSQYTNIFIDEAVKPNKALECILDIKSNYKLYAYTNRAIYHQCNAIEQALLKAQKLEKAWEILKPLCEVVETPVRKDRYLKINGVVVYTFKDQQEFELLKEMLE